MKSIGYSAVVGLVVTMIAGCAVEPAVDVVAEEAAIRDRSLQWNQAVIDKEIDAVMAFYAEDAVQMPAHGPMLEGRDAIRAWILSWLTEPGITNAFAAEDVEVAACGDTAYERGTYRSSMETPEGSTHDVGKYLTVWKKIDDTWYAAVDISNSDLPLPEPEEPPADTEEG